MLIYQILEDDNIVIIEIKGHLSEEDFQQLTRDVDQHLMRTESIKGLLIHVKSFSGWENLKGLFSHLRFVRDHHKKIKKVAFASDSKLAGIIPKLTDHFVSAEVKHFDFTQSEAALEWIRSSETSTS